jgi:arabinofuranan 3-O-arabinosyltransferase
MPTFLLGAVVYIPLLLTKPGKVSADTKSYLYLDPGRMLGRAPYMWDPNIGMGTVTHQNIGYLWPIGPYYWLASAVHLPDWVAQRIWLGSILLLAGIGVRYLLNTLGQRGPHVTAAVFVYALTPFVLTLAARISVILLPYAGLPWLIAFTVLTLRRGGWRYPALFALTVATIGSVNATALVLSGFGPLLWILYEMFVTREVGLKQAVAGVGRIAMLTVGCSLWWLAGLYAQSRYGINVLRYTETAATVAAASLAPEALRGIGYWFFYGEDRYGPWIGASKAYTQAAWVLVVTYLLPILGLAGAAIARFRERAYFVALVVVGMLLSVGGHPWAHPPIAGRGIKAFLGSDAGLAMRSLPRAAPLVVLGLAVLLGSGLAAVTAERERWARPAVAAVMVLALLGLAPLWTGQVIDKNLDRDESIPPYWKQDARYLDSRGDDTRVLEVPGSDFASYRWGTTVDPVTPGLMDRPFVARELIPYGSPPSADLLNALDRQMQESVLDPRSLAPVARLMAVGDINVRSDLTYERYDTPRPRPLWDLLRSAPGLGRPVGFGGTEPNLPRAEFPLNDEQALLTPPSLPDPPQAAALPVSAPEKILRIAPVDRPLIVAGDGEGLVDAAGAGLLDGHGLVLYSATFAKHPEALRREIGRDAALLISDTNRLRARQWDTIRENTGETEQPGQRALRDDPKDQRLDVFPDAGDSSSTVLDSRGGSWAESTSYGNQVSLTPEDRAMNAIDGDPGTAWKEGGFGKATGERIKVHYRAAVTTDHIRLTQILRGVQNRSITEVTMRFDRGAPLDATLDARSRVAPGQDVALGEARTFRTLDIEVTGTDVGLRPRYDDFSPVGFSEIEVLPAVPEARKPRAEDVVRLPVDLLDTAGTASMRNPLTVLLTRNRTLGTVAVRRDEETSLQREFSLPTRRSFTLAGQARLSNAATDDVLDRTLGQRAAGQGGVTATSRRRLPGGLANRASSAIDGDPTTWYSPGFLGQNGEYMDYQMAAPISFDHMDLTVLNDGRHSVPRRLRIEADGKLAAQVTVPAVADQAKPNGRRTVRARFPRVTGKQVRFVVDDGPDAVRDVTTIDYYTGNRIVMPIGIVDLGVPGLRERAPSGRLDQRCRSGLLTMDGRDVPVALHGTVADALADKSIGFTACNGRAVQLGAGQRLLRSAPGGRTGIDLDQLTLRSAAGGGPDHSSGPLDSSSASRRNTRPAIEVKHRARTSFDVDVRPTDDGNNDNNYNNKAFWLVLGQSHNLGWTASANGHDLGEPTLVNGYANGWQVSASNRTIHIHLEWKPQNVIWVLIWLSVVAVAASLFLACWPRRSRLSEGLRGRAAGDDPYRRPLDVSPSMPRPFRRGRLLRYSGPPPSPATTTVTAGLAFVIFGAVIGPWAGLALAAVSALALRMPRARPLLTVGSPALLLISAAYIIAKQVRDRLPTGFDWPTYFERVHQLAWAAVALLVLDVVIDRLWLRRWWPTDDSPN